MLLQRMRQFLTVVDAGSIAAGAARLHIAQPALSRQLRNLEREVGTPLLVRDRRGVRLTAAGAALHQGASDLFARLDTAVREARDAHVGTTGAVRLGVTRMVLDSARLSAAIASVRRTMPGIRLDVAEVSSLDQARLVRTRDLDITIGFADFEGDALVKREVLYEETLDAVIIGTTHPLAIRPGISVDDLRELPCLVLRQRHTDGYPRMFLAFRRAGITNFEEHDTVEGLYALAAAGHGWIVAARSQADNPPLGTSIRPLHGLSVPLPVSMRWRSTESSRAARNVMNAMRAAFGPAGAAPAEPGEGAGIAIGRTRDIELAQLQAFIAAVEEGSMSAAAERLGVTQSGVSRRVSALERAVGCRLVDRAAHGIVATSAGQAFWSGAREVAGLADRAVALAQLAAGSHAGVCRIGALPPELTGGLQNLALQRAVREYPRIRIELSELLPERQSEMLLAGEIDIGVGGTFPGMEVHPRLASVLLFEDVVDGVMLAEGHPLASRAWIRASELAAETFAFIDRRRGRRVHDAVAGALAPLGLAQHVSTHAGPREIWRAIAGGDGWTIGTRAQRARPPRGIVGVPMEGLHIPWGIGLLWRRDEEDDAVRRLLEVFRTTRNPEIAVVVATVRAQRTAGAPAAPALRPPRRTA